MYNTANNLEELDIELELNSFQSVGHAIGRERFWVINEEDQDVDFYIIMLDDTEEEEIKKLLNICGFSAWLEYDLNGECKMVKVEHPAN